MLDLKRFRKDLDNKITSYIKRTNFTEKILKRENTILKKHVIAKSYERFHKCLRRES